MGLSPINIPVLNLKPKSAAALASSAGVWGIMKIETKMIDNKMPNQNYLYNQSTILKKVLDLVKKEIN